MKSGLSRLLPVFDQVLFAASNFVLAIILARFHSAEVVAAYGVGLSVALILQAMQRHVIIIPLNVMKKIRNKKLAHTWLGTHFITTGCMLSFVGVFCSLATQLLMSGYVNLVAFSVLALVVVYMQAEFGRAFLIATNRTAFVIVPAFLQISAVLYIASTGFDEPYGYLKILSVLVSVSVVSAVLLVFLAGGVEWIHGDRLLRRLMRKYAGWGTAGVIASSGYNHVPLFVLGVYAAPIQAAAFVTMRNLLQPSQVLMRGLDIVDKRKVGGLRYQNTSSMQGKAFRLCLIYASIAALFATAVILAGDHISRLVYGPKYAEFAHLLIPWGAVYVLMALLYPLESLAYASDKTNTYYSIRIVAGLTAASVSFPLVWNFGAAGAVISCLIGWLITVGSTFLLLRKSDGRMLNTADMGKPGEA
ncbi:MAG: hypothetical protein AAGA76_02070 [Pseudomonadota bacterium]